MIRDVNRKILATDDVDKSLDLDARLTALWEAGKWLSEYRRAVIKGHAKTGGRRTEATSR